MRKTLVALALTGALISPPALLDSIWTFLTALWEESSPDEPRPQPDGGCEFDPSGCPDGS